jgi:hypothetical protein
MIGVETVAQRFRPEPASSQCASTVGRRQIERPEAARVVEGDARAVRHVEDDMVVARGRGMGVVKRPGIWPAPRPETIMRPDMPRCRSASRRYPDRRGCISTAAAGAGRGRRSAARPALGGNGQRRSLAAHAARAIGALHRGHKAAADGLDLGQFGHGFPFGGASASHCAGGAASCKEGRRKVRQEPR